LVFNDGIVFRRIAISRRVIPSAFEALRFARSANMGFPLNDFPDACILLDDKDQVVGINLAGEKLLNLIKADIAGKTLSEVFSGRAVYLRPDGRHQDGHKNTYAHLPNGLVGCAEIKFTALQGSDGDHLGRIAILRTIDFHPQDDALRNQNEILLALQETSFDLHSSLDLKVVLHNIVERACKLLGTTHGYLDILREMGELDPVVGVGALAEALKFKVDKGEGMAGFVWNTGKPLFIPAYDLWAGRLSHFPHGLIRAILGMPLLFKGQVIGVIGIARGIESDLSFSEEDIALLRRFADLAVLALQNARLFEQAQIEIAFRRKTECELRNSNQVLQFQIERIELLQGQLQEQAVRDSLTNLFNRRYLQEMLAVEFARAKRSETSQAILMLDCDHLKDINDTYGHNAGDDSLVYIADVIRESIRAGDIACRYGGDEFVVVLGNVTEKIAFERAENLRNRIAANYILHKKEKVYVSVSIGIAMFPDHGAFGELLLQKADQALYAAKREGKNRVLLYSDVTGD
jgi:diguanylate cyclase (GGDEF)-like protein